MAETSSRFIGQGVKPHKTTRFLTGSGVYVSDIRLPNMLHAAVVRSTHAHAIILSIDVKQALRLNGVVGVWTGADVKDRIALFPESFEIHPRAWLEGVKPILQGPRPAALAQRKVHYVGEPVAIVVAEDRHRAEDAVDEILVEYEALPVVVDPEVALKAGAALVHDESKDNVVFSFKVSKGDVDQALRDARSRLGMSSKLILCFLRDLTAQDAMATLDEALAYKERIVAVGLDSAEIGNPPAKFKEPFARARNAGFLTVAHAGEEGPAAYVREAIDVLHVARIDHGNRSLDDDALVARLAAARIPLTMCPLSNLRLCVVDDLSHYPVRRMLKSGLLVTINSDDPAYFGGYVNENYLAVWNAIGLTREELITLARNSFEASFLDSNQKMAMIDELNSYVAAHS